MVCCKLGLEFLSESNSSRTDILISQCHNEFLKRAISSNHHRVMLRNYQSVLQSAYALLNRVLPPLQCGTPEQIISCVPNNDAHSSAIQEESILWQFSFNLIAALASYNSSLFLASWQLFLADPLATDDALFRLTNQECGKMMAMSSHSICGQSEGGHRAVVDAQEIFLSQRGAKASQGGRQHSHDGNLKFVALTKLTFRSVLIRAVVSAAAPQVRVAAIRCLRCVYSGLPLARWFKPPTPPRASPVSTATGSTLLGPIGPRINEKAVQRAVGRGREIGDGGSGTKGSDVSRRRHPPGPSPNTMMVGKVRMGVAPCLLGCVVSPNFT